MAKVKRPSKPKPPKVFDYPYGFKSHLKLNEIELELYLFLHAPGKDECPGFLGKPMHFKNIVNMLWGKNKMGLAEFQWHPWAELMLERACEHDYLGLSGCASSGKTDFAAIWGIVNWLAAQKETMVLATSTSLKDSRKRIWGSIVKYFTEAHDAQGSRIPLPGRLINSDGVIRTNDGSGVFSDKNGISLIAGEQKKQKESIGKLIGVKNERVILLCDEMPELSEALIEATANLLVNPWFQMIGMGNFASMYDPFGVFIRPKAGYDSITVEDEEWDTERGVCIHFDGTKSPNMREGKDIWPIYGIKKFAEHKKAFGENSIQFWRMVRSFPCPEGSEAVIYSEADIISGGAEGTPLWLEPPTLIAALDPGFTNGGDRSVLMLGAYGITTDNKWTIHFRQHKLLREDVLKSKHTPRNYQIATQLGEICDAERILPVNVAMDVTGAGSVLHDIITKEWKPGVLKVQFGGKASELPVSQNDIRPSHEYYYNRVSELWFSGKDFMSGGQLKGITPDLAREMKARLYETTKGIGLKIKVEPKADMKERIGFSPDLADAAMVLIDLCRQRFGAIAGGHGAGSAVALEDEKRLLEASDAVYANVDYSEQEDEMIYYVGD